MKLRKLTFLALLSIGIMACNNNEGTEETTSEGQTEVNEQSTAEKVTYAINNDASVLVWEGTMLGVKSHTGTLNFKDGMLVMQGDKVVDGSFTIDWSTMATTDTNYSEDYPAAYLIQHLKSPDFFAVDSLGDASFKITGMKGNTITGDLTIRGITNTEKVTDVVISSDANGLTATGNLVFDRQKYEVSYKNTMGDAVISDDIETKVTLKAAKANS